MNRKICQSVALSLLVGALSTAMAQTQPMNSTNKTETATFGGGCYWCTEAIFQMLPGVKSVTSGFAGGTKENPSYEEVCTGNTGHAEVIHIEYDPAVVSYEKLLAIFWQAHDPTTLDRQGADVGTQYRSIILYNDEAQKVAAERSKVLAQKDFKQRIVTEIVPLKKILRGKIGSPELLSDASESGILSCSHPPKSREVREKVKGIKGIKGSRSGALRALRRRHRIFRRGELFFEIDDFFDLSQKPAVNFRELKDLFYCESGSQGVPDEENPLGIGNTQLLSNQVSRQNLPVTINLFTKTPWFAIATETVSANFQ